jgi:hypothetical protein
VDPIVAVHTEPVDITGVGVGRHERRIPLEAARSGVTFDLAAGARVSFEVVPVFAERRFSAVELTALGPQRASLRPPSVELVLRGDPTVLERLRASAVVPWVDTTGVSPARGPGTARVQLRPLPEGVDLVGVSPAEVIVVPLR